MASFEKNVLMDVNNELSLIGERIRDLALEQVAYLADREMLPKVQVSLGKEPWEVFDGTTDNNVPMGWSYAEGYASINALPICEEGVTNMLGSALILSMGGLYRCVSFPYLRNVRLGDTKNDHIPHWSTRSPGGSQDWLKNASLISIRLTQAEEEARLQRLHRTTSSIKHEGKFV